ncbi:MAG: sulfatase-like hydrolase/transferase [Betaproteobacteria bacterium]|nr:sulfatase-like hydrolase/transferase [Betaproteobacteria bacterium]
MTDTSAKSQMQFLWEWKPIQTSCTSLWRRDLPKFSPNENFSELIPQELANNALVAYMHHTTYPYTSDAVFSILSGLYPAGRRELITKGGFKQHKVLLAKLSEKGYQTGAYVPNVSSYEADEKMLRQLGVRTTFVAGQQASISTELRHAAEAAESLHESILKDSPYFEMHRNNGLLNALRNDIHALEQMKLDMRSTLRAGKKFAFIYMPQIGHGPWFQIGRSQSRKAYGRALMNLQSVWLRGLVKELQDHDALKNTVIVLTSDHGVRTKIEDPELKVGTISGYSFHVPLIVFAPSTFREPLMVRTLTSHIDIESSMSLLLGLQTDMGVSEGVPLWDVPVHRRLYFFAGAYGGADGFHQDDYFMNNVITEAQFKSSTMDFSTLGKNLTDPIKQEFVTKAFSDFKKHHHRIIFGL